MKNNISKTGWLEVKLEDVAKRITKGGTPTTFGFAFKEKGVNFIKVENIKNGRLDLESIVDFISEDAHSFQAKSILEENDILFSIAGTIGEICIIRKEYLPANTNQALAIIKGTSDIIIPSLLKFYLEAFVAKVKLKARGGAMNNVSLGDLKEFTINIPPLLEQKAIVDKLEQLFSELDKGVENLEKAREQLKIYRQAVLKEAFAGKLTEQWRKKQTGLPAAQTLLEQIKTQREEEAQKSGKSLKPIAPLSEAELADLPELPPNWIWVRLDDLGHLGRGKSKHRPRNDKKLFGGKYPFIQTGEVKAAGYLIQSFKKTYSELGLSQSKLWPKGTLCITIAANIAETAFLGIQACFPDSIVGFIGNERLVSSKFIFYFFKGNQRKLEAFAPATAQKNINLNTLENLIIPYCSMEEQEQIVQQIEERLSNCDNLEKIIEESLKKTDALRQSILKKAFSGQLLSQPEITRLQNHPDWEPASTLLKRIQNHPPLPDGAPSP